MTQADETIKIGSRGSPLALRQAEATRDALMNVTGLPQERFEIITFLTSGDRFLSSDLQDIGGKGLFTKELEEALFAGKIHLAVHSAKDMPTALPAGLRLACFLPREDVRDAFVSEEFSALTALPHGAIVGTASVRRGAQILRIRPDINITLLRGNVQTRLKKLRETAMNATILAYAGLIRLNMREIATDILSPEIFPTAPAQGAICIEIHENASDFIVEALEKMNCRNTEICVTAERAYLSAVDGSCKTPLATRSHLSPDGKRLSLQAFLYAPDGSETVTAQTEGLAADALTIGYEAGEKIRAGLSEALRKKLYG